MKNLPKDVRMFITNVKGLSYSKIIREVKQRWGIEPSESTISYYRRGGVPRIRSINPARLKAWEWDWLIGLYYADGTKYTDAGYHYIIKFSLQLDEKEIVRRLVSFLHRLGYVKAWVKKEGGCTRVLVCSKKLYELLPSKDNPYEPKDELAFLAGLVDGDGSITKSIRSNGYVEVRMIFSQISFLHLVDMVMKIGKKHGNVSLRVSKNPYNEYSDNPEHRVNFSKKAIENLKNTLFRIYCIKSQSLF